MFYGSPHILLNRHISQDIQLRVMTNTLVRLLHSIKPQIWWKHAHYATYEYLTPLTLISDVKTQNIVNHKRRTKTNVEASPGDRPLSWPYSPGRNRRDAAAGPAEVRAEEGDRLRTAVPAPEGSWDTALDRSGRGLENHNDVWAVIFEFRTNHTGFVASLRKPRRSQVFKGTESQSSPKFFLINRFHFLLVTLWTRGIPLVFYH